MVFPINHHKVVQEEQSIELETLNLFHGFSQLVSFHNEEKTYQE